MKIKTEITIGPDDARRLLRQGRKKELLKVFRGMIPADVADLIEELPPDDRDDIFRLFEVKTAADVLAEIEHGYIDDLSEDISPERFADLVEEMPPDEAVDVLSELPDERAVEVLDAMESAERREVIELLDYGEGSAGQIMTPEVFSQPETATAGEAAAALRQERPSDPVFYIYVTQRGTGSLVGFLSVTELLNASPGVTVGTLAATDFICCRASDDQQEVIRKFRKYDLWVMPVVNESEQLLGRITVDDVLDVFREEADEDLAHMVGAPDIDQEEDALLRITRMRLPWLLITMMAGLVNSVIIRHMMTITSREMIAVFVPAILAMGGNTGMQSSAICIRGIALGHSGYNRLLRIVSREIRIGFLLGLVCGSASGTVVWVMLTWLFPGPISLSPVRLALVVGLAMCAAMTFASSFGVTVPIVLHRLNVDPAVSSGPFITTANDLSASVIYLLTCLLLLKSG